MDVVFGNIMSRQGFKTITSRSVSELYSVLGISLTFIPRRISNEKYKRRGNRAKLMNYSLSGLFESMNIRCGQFFPLVTQARKRRMLLQSLRKHSFLHFLSMLLVSPSSDGCLLELTGIALLYADRAKLRRELWACMLDAVLDGTPSQISPCIVVETSHEGAEGEQNRRPEKFHCEFLGKNQESKKRPRSIIRIFKVEVNVKQMKTLPKTAGADTCLSRGTDVCFSRGTDVCLQEDFDSTYTVLFYAKSLTE